MLIDEAALDVQACLTEEVSFGPQNSNVSKWSLNLSHLGDNLPSVYHRPHRFVVENQSSSRSISFDGKSVVGNYRVRAILQSRDCGEAKNPCCT